MNESLQQSPEFDGQCAFALSIGKKGVAGDPNVYVIQDGKKYLFLNRGAKFVWRVLPRSKSRSNATWSQS